MPRASTCRRTNDQIKALDESDAAVAELVAADHIILATGLINFSISSTLKSWVDHIARVGRTFRYSETGPEGLVSGKRVTIVLASGGVYSEGPNAVYDFAVPYLKGVLGFLGVRDFDVIRIEGTGMGEEAVKAALEKASAQAAAVVNAARLAKAA